MFRKLLETQDLENLYEDKEILEILLEESLQEIEYLRQQLNGSNIGRYTLEEEKDRAVDLEWKLENIKIEIERRKGK